MGDQYAVIPEGTETLEPDAYDVRAPILHDESVRAEEADEQVYVAVARVAQQVFTVLNHLSRALLYVEELQLALHLSVVLLLHHIHTLADVSL
jgi:hypothetical protein